MGKFFQEIASSFPLMVSVFNLVFSQILKLTYYYRREGVINFKHLVSAGGMPSSHSALVSSLATAVGLLRGWSSVEFSLGAVFAGIVMYDAAGVRQAAGKQARILNQMLKEKKFDGEKLQEILGHTPIQVFIGAILGVVMTLLIYMFFY